MREVRRGPCPPVLIGPTSAGGKERADAVTFFAKKGNALKAYKNFTAYQHGTVRAALHVMFGEKCCYCESSFAHVQSGDIEHYRPKGGFRDTAGILTKPGYYWLSASWDNLLLSCIDCNRARRHPDDTGDPALMGKANNFPLLDEQRRATRPGSEVHERPLLLDPCSDPVEEYFEFTDQGAIRPATQSGIKHKRAQATIDIVGLQRPLLAKRRGARMKRVEAQIVFYQQAVAEFAKDDTNAGVKHWVEREIADLKNLWAEEDEFSVMVRRRIEAACPEALGTP